MGIADREYVRVDRGGGGRGAVGVRMMSFNTLLIVVNIAVFVLNNGILARHHVNVGYGTAYVTGVTSQQIRRGITLDPPRWQPVPELPGVMQRRIYDPQTVVPHEDGRMGPQFIGVERVAVNRAVLEAYGHFSTGKAFTELQVWRFITFQFLHANLVHLAFNMLGLWFVGGLVESRLGSRRYAAFYLMCGVCGALMYLFLNLAGYTTKAEIPGLLIGDPYTPLVGASAGVFGVLLAAAYLRPNDMVYVMFAIPMKMKTAVYAFTALAAVNLIFGGRNAGGDAAHLGGAIAGAYFIRRPYLLREMVEMVTGKARRGGRSGGGARAGSSRVGRDETAAVDRILEKVRSSGLQSLTESEKRLLRRATESMGDR